MQCSNLDSLIRCVLARAWSSRRRPHHKPRPEEDRTVDQARDPRSQEATADDIAADLALAIHQGLIGPGERTPSQTDLMQAYGCAMGTAASALSKLAAAGLAQGRPGRGTFAADAKTLAAKSAPILDILAAAALCRGVAARGFRTGTSAVMYVNPDPDYGTSRQDQHTAPPRPVDVAPLAALDRHLTRWLSEALYAAARRVAGRGLHPADEHLLEAARAILRDGARRPGGQQPIAASGGPVPDAEDVSRRLWPGQAARDTQTARPLS
jgi:DNA-binding transcriptional regulator YhcF (GntR family)